MSVVSPARRIYARVQRRPRRARRAARAPAGSGSASELTRGEVWPARCFGLIECLRFELLTEGWADTDRSMEAFERAARKCQRQQPPSDRPECATEGRFFCWRRGVRVARAPRTKFQAANGVAIKVKRVSPMFLRAQRLTITTASKS